MNKPKLSFWVKITQSSSTNHWYHDKIGATFLVMKSEVYFDKYKIVPESDFNVNLAGITCLTTARYIGRDDCQVVEGNCEELKEIKDFGCGDYILPDVDIPCREAGGRVNSVEVTPAMIEQFEKQIEAGNPYPEIQDSAFEGLESEMISGMINPGKNTWWKDFRCWIGWHSWESYWDRIQRRRTYSCQWCGTSYKFDPETGATHIHNPNS